MNIAKIIREADLVAGATEFVSDEMLDRELMGDFVFLLIRNTISFAWMLEAAFK